MLEYHKIPTLFERDINGSRKLIEGQFRNQTVEFLKDNLWIFTEKIDGTNIRVHWDGHRVEFGGRTDRAEISVALQKCLDTMFGGNENEQLFEQRFGDADVILFGEGYGPKIQKVGRLYRKNVSFILFDVLVGHTWLSRDEVEEVAKLFGIDVVPIVGSGTLEEGVSFVKTMPTSTIGDAPMEGIVARPKVELKDQTGRRVIVKIKTVDFV